MQSMTGHGRAELMKGESRFIVEIKSRNSKFFDARLRIPQRYISREQAFSKMVREKFPRGYFEVNLQVENGEEGEDFLEINIKKTNNILALLNKLKKEFGLSGKIDLSLLSTFKDIFEPLEYEMNIEEDWLSIREVLSKALDDLERMRKVEGDALRIDIEKKMHAIEDKLRDIKVQSVESIKSYRDKLRKRISELIENEKIDNSRLEQEVVIFVEKSDIEEEIVRFQSHISQFRKFLDDDEVGRKLEFLLQEMLREANTISSKVNDAKICQSVVEIKTELERIKEQVANIQ